MIDDSWYERPSCLPEHLAAGGVIIRRQGDDLYFAAVGEGEQAGYILPKGHVEPGEEIETAARREIEEEAGLAPCACSASWVCVSVVDFRESGWKKTHYFLYLTEESGGRPTDPNHDYRLLWLRPGWPSALVLARSA